MPVVGAVLVLSQDSEATERSLETLSLDKRITMGERTADRLPVAVVTDSLDEDRKLWKELQRLPGVVHTDVVWAAMDESPEETT